MQPASPPHASAFYVFRQQPAAMVQLSDDGRTLRELPVAVPEGCSLDSVSAPPVGETLAIEFRCPFGQAVTWLDTASGKMTQPVTDSDSHFMAWAPDGQAGYLKVATMSRPHIVRAPLNGKPRNVPVTEMTYDLAPVNGSSGDFLFSFSRGMGLGSEMWYANSGGKSVKQVIADPQSYLSFARWSPDGSQIAFIKIPDAATPFSVGELWVMEADGLNPRRLADADAGHGFAEAWAPDGQQIAFVVRDNPGDAQADQDPAALRSSIAVVSASGGPEMRITHLLGARVAAPSWSPDGMSIAFTATVDDKMNVYVVDVGSGQEQKMLAASACCAVWVTK
jgi:Tol biopolymer transport system component